MIDKSKIVRQANSRGGPCELLGPLLDEQTMGLVYRCESGLKAHIRTRLVHLEPCRSCPDHHRSRFPCLAFKCGPKQNSCSQTHCDCSWWKAVLCADQLAKLLLALGVDPKQLASENSAMMRDLQRVCIVCGHKQRCEHDLAAGTAAQRYGSYCPNSSSLAALSDSK
jgi:hypothetical protein